jgi:very-short-patch-repair endonuclease
MRVAETQRGVIHRDQISLAGLTRSAIAHRRRIGWLHPLLSDVYLLGRARIEPFGWETAAVLQYRGFVVVSHASAAALWNQLPSPPATPTVTIVGRDARSTTRLTIHRVAAISPADIVLHRGLPVTSPARTLIDRAASLPQMELENELLEMLRHRLVTREQIRAAIAWAPGRAGTGKLRALVDGSIAPARTRSHYERKLRALLSAADLPPARINDKVLGHEVDFHWPQHKLIVEFDGYQFHAGRRAFEQDRLRDQRLVGAGYRVLRITARQLDQTPYAVIARIAAALALPGASAAV